MLVLVRPDLFQNQNLGLDLDLCAKILVSVSRPKLLSLLRSTLCCKKVCHPTFNNNFDSSCLIPVIFGKVITE